MSNWNFGIPHQPQHGLLLWGPAPIQGVFPSEGKGIAENLAGTLKQLLNSREAEFQPLRTPFPRFCWISLPLCSSTSPGHPCAKREVFPRSQFPANLSPLKRSPQIFPAHPHLNFSLCILGTPINPLVYPGPPFACAPLSRSRSRSRRCCNDPNILEDQPVSRGSPSPSQRSHISCLARGGKVGKTPAMRSRAGRTPKTSGLTHRLQRVHPIQLEELDNLQFHTGLRKKRNGNCSFFSIPFFF